MVPRRPLAWPAAGRRPWVSGSESDRAFLDAASPGRAPLGGAAADVLVVLVTLCSSLPGAAGLPPRPDPGLIFHVFSLAVPQKLRLVTHTVLRPGLGPEDRIRVNIQ